MDVIKSVEEKDSIRSSNIIKKKKKINYYYFIHNYI
jgi:hypothetical protein